MGRYYNGDIEGKFWFAVQSSTDGEFFGAIQQESGYLSYYVDDLEAVETGLAECDEVLGEDDSQLNAFFETHSGYNDQMMIDWYKAQYNLDIDASFIQNKLVWYARKLLGLKIHACVKQQGDCSFDVEL